MLIFSDSKRVAEKDQSFPVFRHKVATRPHLKRHVAAVIAYLLYATCEELIHFSLSLFSNCPVFKILGLFEEFVMAAWKT